MFQKVSIYSIAVSICFLVFFTGCAPQVQLPSSQADLAMKFAPDKATIYRVNTEVIKDYKFEQPTLDKLKEEQTSTVITATFQQRIQDVDQDGTAVAEVTIRDIEYLVKEKDEIKFDFDSKRPEDKEREFAKLIGRSYTISISPDGTVKALDVESARKAIGDGYEQKMAVSFLEDKKIVKRHKIPALPDVANKMCEAGDSWDRIVVAPRGYLLPKYFKKTYTLQKIDNLKGRRIALVNMNAAETSERAKGVPLNTAGMGPIAKMFDTQETFNGDMTLDLDTGTVTGYNEKLVATYIAAEAADEQAQGKGPDTLTMVFTHAIRMEIVD